MKTSDGRSASIRRRNSGTSIGKVVAQGHRRRLAAREPDRPGIHGEPGRRIERPPSGARGGESHQLEHVVPTVSERHSVGGPAGETGDGLADCRIAAIRVRPGVGAGNRVPHPRQDAFGQRPAAFVPVEVDRDIRTGTDVGGELEHLGTDRVQRNGFHAGNVTKRGR